jgi:competence ComEA-like helix-hairpin-helix protein
MLTPDERRAVIFLSFIAAAGGVIRVVRGADAAPGSAVVAPHIRGEDIARQAARSLETQRLAQPLGPGERVALNRASVAELDRLPGIGPALARRIAAYRDSLGAFRQVQELEAVPGIGPALVRKLTPFISVP